MTRIAGAERRAAIVSLTIAARDAADAERIARSMYGWSGDALTTEYADAGCWRVTIDRQPTARRVGPRR